MEQRYKYVGIVLLIIECLIGSACPAFKKMSLHRIVGEADKDNSKLIDEILKKDPTLLNAQDHNGDTPIMRAVVVKNNEKNINYLLSQENLDLTKVDTKWGANALAWAIDAGMSLEVIQSILKKDPSLLNTPSWNTKQVTPFYQAVMAGNIELAEALAKMGDINFNEKDLQGKTLLYQLGVEDVQNFVPDQPNEELFLFLLSKGASLAEKSTCLGFTKKNTRSKSVSPADKDVGKEETVLHGVLRNISFNKKPPKKPVNEFLPNSRIVIEPPDPCVVVYDRLIMIEEHQAQVRAALLVADSDGLTPLHVALKMQNQDIARKLIEIAKSGDESFKNDFKIKVLDVQAEGKAPLHIAIINKFGESVIDELIKLKANPLQESEADKKTPLQYADGVKSGTGIVDILKSAENSARREAQQNELSKSTVAPSTSSTLIEQNEGGGQSPLAPQISPAVSSSSGQQSTSLGSSAQLNLLTTGTPEGTLSPQPTNQTKPPQQDSQGSQSSTPSNKIASPPAQKTPDAQKAPESNEAPAVRKNPLGSQIGTPPVSTNSNLSHLGGSNKSQGILLKGGAFVGASLLIIGVIYGIRKMLKGENKQTDEHEAHTVQS